VPLPIVAVDSGGHRARRTSLLGKCIGLWPPVLDLRRVRRAPLDGNGVTHGACSPDGPPISLLSASTVLTPATIRL